MKTGLFMTTYNQLEKTKTAVASLVDSLKESVPTGFVIIDNHSTDGTVEWAKENRIPLVSDEKGNSIAAAFNQGIRYFLRDNEIEYIGAVHNDMLFYKGWLELIIRFIKEKGYRGKFSPNNTLHHSMTKEEAERYMSDVKSWSYDNGNECPWIITADICRKDNIYFDENYVGIGGYDDWDFNRMIINAGYKVIILRDSYIWHECMGTRKFLDTNPDAHKNGAHYCRKWGDGNCPV